MRRGRFKLGNLLSLAKQRKLSRDIHDIKALSNLDILDDFTDLSSIDGVLSLPHDGNGGRELYPIIQSHVFKAVIAEKGTEEARCKELFAKSARFHPKLEPSESEALKINAMLWMILVGIKKRHFDGYFYPNTEANKELTREK